MQTIFNDYTYDPPLDKQFSVVISRDASGDGYGGSLTVGGVPSLTDPTVNVSSTSYTSASLQTVAPYTELAYYAIDVDAFVVDSATSDAGARVIIDTGNDYIEIPAASADAFNSHWSPAGSYDANGFYVIDCDATSGADFAVAIGGVDYQVNPVDLIRPYDSSGTSCMSTVIRTSGISSGLSALGDPFLRNVVAVFDWQDSVMS